VPDQVRRNFGNCCVDPGQRSPVPLAAVSTRSRALDRRWCEADGSRIWIPGRSRTLEIIRFIIMRRRRRQACVGRATVRPRVGRCPPAGEYRKRARPTDLLRPPLETAAAKRVLAESPTRGRRAGLLSQHEVPEIRSRRSHEQAVLGMTERLTRYSGSTTCNLTSGQKRLTATAVPANHILYLTHDILDFSRKWEAGSSVAQILDSDWRQNTFKRWRGCSRIQPWRRG